MSPEVGFCGGLAALQCFHRVAERVLPDLGNTHPPLEETDHALAPEIVERQVGGSDSDTGSLERDTDALCLIRENVLARFWLPLKDGPCILRHPESTVLGCRVVGEREIAHESGEVAVVIVLPLEAADF